MNIAINDSTSVAGPRPAVQPRAPGDLLGALLADVEADINVAARDLQISDASFVRLRRAMGRVGCAQSVLETMRAGSVRGNRDEWVLRMRMRMREAVELLAKEWPKEYPAEAVEWLLAAPDVKPTLDGA
jgi:hypothetical protein